MIRFDAEFTMTVNGRALTADTTFPARNPATREIIGEVPDGGRKHLNKAVIARSNDTEYGLGASVWGRDLEAVQRIGRQLEAGTVWLNEIHQYSPFQAFGGHKQSGIGCENSVHGLLEYANRQTITLNRAVAKVKAA